jgi:methionyl-tRNA formyltransferase
VTCAVVFAYHNVGVRCLAVLLAHGIEVPLVFTHEDDAGENVWFASVARFARERDIEVLTAPDPNSPECLARLRACAPEFVFSFYYRRMLGAALLGTAARGALNMHGSLLPKYRGRAPVNWAVVRGERETGASLHYMTEKPDAGEIVGRERVPILPDDTALDVLNKVTVAAELLLDRLLPELVAGRAPREPQALAEGSYFGARRPEDGLIDWRRPAAEIHNLVRGVAPPYPGAFSRLGAGTLKVLRARLGTRLGPPAAPLLGLDERGLYARCGDGVALRLLACELDGAALDPQRFRAELGARDLPLA